MNPSNPSFRPRQPFGRGFGMSVAAVAAGVFMSTAGAQPASGAGPSATQPAQASQSYRGLRASKVAGLEVRNPQGQDIGEVSDMMVDMRSSRVLYAILSFDPGIMQGDRLFAVPTSQLRMAPDRDNLVFDMRKETLEQAGMTRSEWQQRVRDPSYLATLDRVWGIRESTPQARLWRISDLLGRDVKDRRGQDIGEVDDVVVDMARQRVHYVALEFDLGWTSPEQKFAFPLRAFDPRAGQDELVLDVDRSRVQAMRSFTDDRYANLNDPTWVRDVDRILIVSAPARDTSTRLAGGQPPATGGPSDPQVAEARARRADRN